MLNSYHIIALASGCFAALSSIVGKFTFGEEFYIILHGVNRAIISIDWMILDLSPKCLQWCTWCCLLALLVFCNILMWFALSKAMMMSPNTIEVTSINAAANFLFSSLMGVVLFNEKLSPLWIFGMILILIGLLLIHNSKSTGGKEMFVSEPHCEYSKVKVR